MFKEQYPNIFKAFEEVAGDNGFPHEQQPENFATVGECSTNRHNEHLKEIDNWLGTLTQEDLETCCAGEQTEMFVIFKKGGEIGHKAYDLIAQYFDPQGPDYTYSMDVGLAHGHTEW